MKITGPIEAAGYRARGLKSPARFPVMKITGPILKQVVAGRDDGLLRKFPVMKITGPIEARSGGRRT